MIHFNDFFTNELFDSGTLHTLFLTLTISSAALVFSWFFSLVFLYFRNRFIFTFFRVLSVLPGFAYALMVLSLLRTLGVEHRYSMVSVFLAWILAGVPYLCLSISTSIQDLDKREKEVLQCLGASPIWAFYHFEFLRTLPAQAQVLLQQFWLYLTSFSLVMILGGGYPNETLEVGIYTSVRLDRVNFTHALALGLWQILLLIPLRVLLNRIQKSSKTAVREGYQNLMPWKRSLKTIGFVGLGLVLILIVVECFSKFQNSEVLSAVNSLLASLGTSLVLASTCAICTLICAGFFYYFGLGFGAELGAYLSPMLFTLIWWKYFGFTVLPFANALIVQIILFLPWVARSLYPLLKRMRVSELEAARSLGCSPLRSWLSVEWPRVRAGVFFSLAWVLVLSLSEVTSVLLFSQNEFEPLSVWVQNAFMRFHIDEALMGTAVLVFFSYLFLTLGMKRT